ncbi:MAG TPA: DUF4375 domain-containing protein [Polyangiaceae bacterium]|jgi:hypothetical protein
MMDLLERSDEELASEVGARLQDMIYGAGYAAMSREEQNVYLVYVLDAEVANGGLEQFFGNSSGNCAVRTAVALEEIGLDAASKVLRTALSVFPDAGPAEDRSTRYDQLETLGARRNAWDGLGSHLEGIHTRTGSYIHAHAMAFGLPP